MKSIETPWGESQTCETIAPGIISVSTAGHGGFMISQSRRDAMPEEIRRINTFAGGNNYEEDCDWALVALAFPECFLARELHHAIAMKSHYKLSDAVLTNARAECASWQAWLQLGINTSRRCQP